MSYNTQRPHLAAFVVLKKDGKCPFVFRTKTDWMNEHYGLPAGKVEKEESCVEAAVREAKEEAGVEIRAENLKYMITVHRFEGAEDHAPEWIDVYFETEKWKGEPFNAEPDKHGHLEWFEMTSLPESTVPSQKFAIEEFTKGKTYSEYGWDKR
jgi:8-oxo-dGTP diphosphatase